MNQADKAFERLREANPIEAQPFPPFEMTGLEMLGKVQDETARNEPMRRPGGRRGALLAAAAVVLLALLVPVLLSDGDSDDSLTTVSPAPTLADGADLAEFAGRVLPQRTFRSDVLGVDFTAELDSIWVLELYQDGALVLQRTRVTDGPRQILAMVRPTGLADVDQTPDRVPDGGGWPLADLEGWLDRYGTRMGVTNVAATTIGGLPATTFRVELPADPACGGGSHCVPFITNRQSVDLGFDSERWYQVWWVPVAGFEPIVVIAAEPDEAALAAIDSVAFGEPAPHPMLGSNPWELGFDSLVPAGPVVAPALGGVTFELAAEAHLSQDERAIIIDPGEGTLDVFQPLGDPSGDALSTSEAVLNVLQEAPVTITELEPTTVAGLPARAFVLTDGPNTPSTLVMTMFRRSNGESVVWLAPTTAALWLVEAPAGPMVIAASRSGPGELPAELTDIADLLVATLEFGDL